MAYIPMKHDDSQERTVSQNRRGYIPNSTGCWSMLVHHQWIGLRENLQETIDFPSKYGFFL